MVELQCRAVVCSSLQPYTPSSPAFQDNVNINEVSNGWIYIFLFSNIFHVYVIFPPFFVCVRGNKINMYLIIIQHSSNWWNNHWMCLFCSAQFTSDVYFLVRCEGEEAEAANWINENQRCFRLKTKQWKVCRRFNFSLETPMQRVRSNYLEHRFLARPVDSISIFRTTTYRSLASWKAEEHIWTVSVRHLTKDVEEFGGMSWLERKQEGKWLRCGAEKRAETQFINEDFM